MFEDVVRAVRVRILIPMTERGPMRVIVLIGLNGAVVVSNNEREDALIFDPICQEGDFEHKEPHGRMAGYATCVVSALTTAWAECGSHCVDWEKATLVGLAMARQLHVQGYDVTAYRDPSCDAPREEGTLATDRQLRRETTFYLLGFPYSKLEECYFDYPLPAKTAANALPDRVSSTPADGPDPLEECKPIEYKRPHAFSIFRDQQMRARGKQRWTLLEEANGRAAKGDEACLMKPSLTSQPNLLSLAKEVVNKGPTRAGLAVPVEVAQDWKSADRTEIEGMRTVMNLLRAYADNYADKGTQDRPLSIAVFGPPGAGKTFAVKQIARHIEGMAAKIEMLEFNLSNFAGPSALRAAFHRVRDVHLHRKLPLVIWDEYDGVCENVPLGWLRYFLSPLADAHFMDDTGTHLLGPGIWVFAGGTSTSFKEFTADFRKENRKRTGGAGKDNEKVRFEQPRKKPDFVRRLDAYMDVNGANRTGPEDYLWLLRRAVSIDGLLGGHRKRLVPRATLTMKAEVANALLLAPHYYHGASSLDAIIRHSIAGAPRQEGAALTISVWNLPSDYELKMHVGDRFFQDLTRLTDGTEFEKSLIDLLTRKSLRGAVPAAADAQAYIDNVKDKILTKVDQIVAPTCNKEPPEYLDEVDYVIGYLTRDDFPGIIEQVCRTLAAHTRHPVFDIRKVVIADEPGLGRAVYITCSRVDKGPDTDVLNRKRLNSKRCRLWLEQSIKETLDYVHGRYHRRWKPFDKRCYGARENEGASIARLIPQYPGPEVQVGVVPRRHEHASPTEAPSKQYYIEFLTEDTPGELYRLAYWFRENGINVEQCSLKPRTEESMSPRSAPRRRRKRQNREQDWTTEVQRKLKGLKDHMPDKGKGVRFSWICIWYSAWKDPQDAGSPGNAANSGRERQLDTLVGQLIPSAAALKKHTKRRRKYKFREVEGKALYCVELRRDVLSGSLEVANGNEAH
jgi:hypothetical protein